MQGMEWIILILIIVFVVYVIIFIIRAIKKKGGEVEALPGKVQQQVEVKKDDTRMCMNCGQNISLRYSVCPYCQQPPTRSQTIHEGQSHDVRPPTQSY
jgi:hypothetical protein